MIKRIDVGNRPDEYIDNSSSAIYSLKLKFPTDTERVVIKYLHEMTQCQGQGLNRFTTLNIVKV